MKASENFTLIITMTDSSHYYYLLLKNGEKLIDGEVLWYIVNDEGYDAIYRDIKDKCSIEQDMINYLYEI